MLIQLRKYEQQNNNALQINVSKQQIVPQIDDNIQEENQTLGFQTNQLAQQIITTDLSTSYQAVVVENSQKKSIIVPLNKNTFKKVKKYIETPQPIYEHCLSETSEMNIICKICLEAQTIDNKLIAPCNCDGSIKYVHMECIKTWLLTKFNIDELKDSKVSCELCHQNYSCEINFSKKYYCSKFFDASIGQQFFIFFFLISGFAFLSLGAYFVSKLTSNNIDFKSYCFGTIVSFITGIILLILMRTAIISTIKVEIVSNWIVKNNEQRNETESTIQICNQRQRSNSLPQLETNLKINKQEKFGNTIFKYIKRNSVVNND